MEKGYRLKDSVVTYFLVGFGCIFSLGIGTVHLFDLDELYFAEITREMIRTDRYGQVTFNFEPLYEKPPLFFWLQAASMHLWGINELGARFPNLVCGLLTLLTLYYIGRLYKGRWFGFLWMCLYATAFLPHFYFKSAIIDLFFNYFLLLAIYFLSYSDTSFKGWLYGGLSIGCALLAKGPMGFIIPLATLSVSYIWFRVVQLKRFILVMLVATGVLSCWLIPEIWSNGWTFIKEFWAYHWLLYQHPVATHAQPWYYHYLVLFFGCFPSSLFAISFLKAKGWIKEDYFAANMQALLVVVLLIFTLVGTKIVHYSSMAYFPITFFAADFFHHRIYTSSLSKAICDVQFLGEAQSSEYSGLFEEHRPDSAPKWPLEIAFRKRVNRKYICSGIGYLFLVVGLVIGSALAIMPWVMRHKELWIALIENQVIRDALALSVGWNYWDSLPGLIYSIGIVLAYYYKCRLVPFLTTFMSVNICALALFLIRIAPKVEAYTQKEMVDFCKACKGKDLYLRTIGFKSAAPLFYADQPRHLTQPDATWLLEGAIDKPSFFILYKKDRSLLTSYKDVTYIKDAGCFSFYKRLPKNF